MYYRQPEYYGDFKCIGGDCKFTCCAGWNITWNEEEINKVKDAPDCSEELRALVDSSFEKRGDAVVYSVILREGQRCPFLTEESLCRIQRELGADYLSRTCSIYPRRYYQILNSQTGEPVYFYRSCELSCPEVAKRLISDRKAMNLVNVPIKQKTTIRNVIMDEDRINNGRLEYLYRGELFEFFYSLISDKKLPLETSISYGVRVAGLLTAMINAKDYDSIPQAISEMSSSTTKNQMLRQNEAIKPNYAAKVGFLGKVMEDIIKDNVFVALKNEDGQIDLGRYREGERTLTKIFGEDEYWLRNIALNLLFEFSIPFYSENYTVLESYSLFLIAFACFKLNAIASASRSEENITLMLNKDYNARFDKMDGIWGFASVISRSLCQNPNNPDKLIKLLKEANLISPAKLAMLIK